MTRPRRVGSPPWCAAVRHFFSKGSDDSRSDVLSAVCECSALWQVHAQVFRQVPLLIFVQRLARFVRKAQASQARKVSKEDLLRLYIDEEYGAASARALMLQQALELRCLIVVLDGVDEASGFERLIEAFVIEELVPGGSRVVVTSRPTGIRRAKYEKGFTIFDLKPLSDEQMRSVIQMQCTSPFFDHLLAFARIRRGHDRIYYEDWSEDVRDGIEGRPLPDLFRDPAGLPNGKMRQMTADGSRFIAHLAHDAEPTSEFIGKLQADFSALGKLQGDFSALGKLQGDVTNSILSKLDHALSKLHSDATSAMIHSAFSRLLPKAAEENGVLKRTSAPPRLNPCHDRAIDRPERLRIAAVPHGRVKLGLLTLKWQQKDGAWTMPSLWNEVMRRTDEMYLAYEAVPTSSGAPISMHRIFSEALDQLARHKEGLEISLGDLKVCAATCHTPPLPTDGKRACRHVSHASAAH